MICELIYDEIQKAEEAGNRRELLTLYLSETAFNQINEESGGSTAKTPAWKAFINGAAVHFAGVKTRPIGGNGWALVFPPIIKKDKI